MDSVNERVFIYGSVYVKVGDFIEFFNVEDDPEAAGGEAVYFIGQGFVYCPCFASVEENRPDGCFQDVYFEFNCEVGCLPDFIKRPKG